VLRCLCGCDASKNLVLAKVGVEFRFGQKTPCPDMSTFWPKKNRKIDTFGRLVRIWFEFGSPKYLVFYAFRRKNELRQAPIVMYYCHLTGHFKSRISRHRARRGLCEIIQSLYDIDVSHKNNVGAFVVRTFLGLVKIIQNLYDDEKLYDFDGDWPSAITSYLIHTKINNTKCQRSDTGRNHDISLQWNCNQNNSTYRTS
jgi:hypothetical protein